MSSLLNSLLSDIDPSAVTQSNAPGARQTQPPKVPKPAQQPATGANGASQAQNLKRKADSQQEGVQTKVQRKDTPTTSNGMNGSARPSPAPNATKPKATTPANSIPYRGTASTGGVAAAKGSNVTAKKPVSTGTPATALSKPVVAAPRPGSGTTTPVNSSAPPKKGSYAAMLAKAKEAQQTKPAAPTLPVKHEPTKILSKKERLARHAEAKAAAKGKKPVQPGQQGKADPKGVTAGQEKRKPADLGYKGTAQPKRQPTELGYKGTARPSASVPAKKLGGGYSDRSRSNSLAPKPKPKQTGRYGGYASWSDEELEDEEEDYESDMSSDMEGGVWDVEHEEQLALAAAKKEDAEALKEENELKRAKEERKRKLMAMNKAAAAKRKY